MEFENIDVQVYSGYKVNERPIAFKLRDREYKVITIVDRWYEGSLGAHEPVMDYFKVRADDDREYILRYNNLFNAWAVMIK